MYACSFLHKQNQVISTSRKIQSTTSVDHLGVFKAFIRFMLSSEGYSIVDVD